LCFSIFYFFLFQIFFDFRCILTACDFLTLIRKGHKGEIWEKCFTLISSSHGLLVPINDVRSGLILGIIWNEKNFTKGGLHLHIKHRMQTWIYIVDSNNIQRRMKKYSSNNIQRRMKKYSMKYSNIIKPKQDVLFNCITEEQENSETQNQALYFFSTSIWSQISTTKKKKW